MTALGGLFYIHKPHAQDPDKSGLTAKQLYGVMWCSWFNLICKQC